MVGLGGGDADRRGCRVRAAILKPVASGLDGEERPIEVVDAGLRVLEVVDRRQGHRHVDPLVRRDRRRSACRDVSVRPGAQRARRPAAPAPGASDGARSRRRAARRRDAGERGVIVGSSPRSRQLRHPVRVASDERASPRLVRPDVSGIRAADPEPARRLLEEPVADRERPGEREAQLVAVERSGSGAPRPGPAARPRRARTSRTGTRRSSGAASDTTCGTRRRSAGRSGPSR